MNARRGWMAAAVALAAFLAWLAWPHRPFEAPAVSGPSVGLRAAKSAPSSVPTTQAPPEPRSTLGDQLNAPGATIQADLRVVLGLVESFRSIFHENPVGTNAEITAALMGKNRLHLALIPPDHPAINGKGELCDRWGQPFFFHQLSGTKMELRSGGPDGVLWTDDDAVLTP